MRTSAPGAKGTVDKGSACDSSQEGIALFAAGSHYITNFDADFAERAARLNFCKC
jgi:hypothetical protein